MSINLQGTSNIQRSPVVDRPGREQATGQQAGWKRPLPFAQGKAPVDGESPLDAAARGRKPPARGPIGALAHHQKPQPSGAHGAQQRHAGRALHGQRPIHAQPPLNARRQPPQRIDPNHTPQVTMILGRRTPRALVAGWTNGINAMNTGVKRGVMGVITGGLYSALRLIRGKSIV